MPQRHASAKPVLVTPTPGHRGMTTLHYAAYCNDPDGVQSQLLSGVPADVRDDNGWTPLHWAIDMAQAGGDPSRVVSILLEHGASPNATDASGFSVLMMACSRNNKSILQQLIKAGADVHERSSESTPLHQAAGCNFHEGIAILLTLGANPTSIDQSGRTPEQLAQIGGFDESVAVLRAARRAK